MAQWAVVRRSGCGKVRRRRHGKSAEYCCTNVKESGCGEVRRRRHGKSAEYCCANGGM